MQMMMINRHDQPVHIDIVYAQQPDRSETQQLGNSLDGSWHQKEERNQKMSHHQHGGNVFPAVRRPVANPEGLLRNVGIPNQHVLGERDVRPKDHKRELELTEVVIVFCCDGISH